MIRGVDNKGCAILGITRRELEGLLAGLRCCFPVMPAGGGGPHVCLWFAETDAELVAKLAVMYPEGKPAKVEDYRTAASPDDATTFAVRTYNANIGGRWLVLMLNDMRSAKSETVRPVARARTSEGLRRLLERERVEQYREPRHELEQGSGDWVKSYRRGGPLEWYNEPVFFGGVVEAWIVTDAPPGLQLITEAQANEIPTVDELGELYGATARAEVGKHG